MQEDMSNSRRITELKKNSLGSMQFDHHITIVSMTVWQVQSSVGKVEYFEVRTVGQCSQEYFNWHMFGGKVRHGVYSQLTQVLEER